MKMEKIPMPTYQLVKEIPVEDTVYDLVVAGGGPAGSSAAICAARLGAKVLLVEGTGCLGGMGTSGLVCAFDPMADGEQGLVGGFMLEVVETMYRRGFLAEGIVPDRWRRYYDWTQFRAEGLKLVLDEFAAAAGVEVRFFTKVVDADCGGRRVKGVIVNNADGFRYIPARTFVDATGDAVLSDLCGVACEVAGRDTPRIMPATLPAVFSGVDWSRENIPTQCPAAVELIEKEYAAGNFTHCDRLFVGISRVGRDTGYMNGGHIFNLDACNNASLSQGMMLGRKIVREYERFLRKYSPACETIELVQTASLMGVRESRRIRGEYTLTIRDFLAHRQFPDQIGIFNKFVDIHPYDCSREDYDRFQQEKEHSTRLGVGEWFGLPYGILVPREFDNLWVAGRCVSSDVMTQGSIRVMPACSMMGQAAGTAAVQSIRTGKSASGIDTAELVETLRSNGANLPQKELSTQLTRNPE